MKCPIKLLQVFCAVLVVGSAACGSRARLDDTARSPDRVVVTGSAGPETDSFFLGVRRGMPLGRRVTLALEAARMGESLAIVIERATASAPDVLIVRSSPDDHASDSLMRAVSRGISVIVVGPDPGVGGLYGRVEPMYAAGAELLGANLQLLLGDRLSYVLLHRAGAGSLDAEARARFRSGAAGAFDRTCLREVDLAATGITFDEALAEVTQEFPSVGLIVATFAAPALSEERLAAISPRARVAVLNAAPSWWHALETQRAAALVGWCEAELGEASASLAVAALTDAPDADRVVQVQPVLVEPDSLAEFGSCYGVAAVAADQPE